MLLVCCSVFLALLCCCFIKTAFSLQFQRFFPFCLSAKPLFQKPCFSYALSFSFLFIFSFCFFFLLFLLFFFLCFFAVGSSYSSSSSSSSSDSSSSSSFSSSAVSSSIFLLVNLLSSSWLFSSGMPLLPMGTGKGKMWKTSGLIFRFKRGEFGPLFFLWRMAEAWFGVSKY